MFDGLDDWRRLSALAEIGDMATAAERLGITRNALSKALIRLEESCGVPLFERLPEGRVSPTPLGGEVLEDIKQMLQQSEVLQKKVDLARSAAAQDEAAGVKFSMRIPAPDNDRLDALLALLAKTQVDGFGLKVSKTTGSSARCAKKWTGTRPRCATCARGRPRRRRRQRDGENPRPPLRRTNAGGSLRPTNPRPSAPSACMKS